MVPACGFTSPIFVKTISSGNLLSISYFMALTSLLVQLNEVVQLLIVADEVANCVNSEPKAVFILGMPYPIRSSGAVDLLPALRIASRSSCYEIQEIPAINR